MEVRAQLVVVGLVALGWGASNLVTVRPVLGNTAETERLSLAALEGRVARNPDEVVTTRVLLRRYLEHGMTRLARDTYRRAPARTQRDGAVSLYAARAEEALGNVAVANALVNGALSRCGVVPAEFGDGAGCDVRTQTELSIEGAALDRMLQWNVSPVSDPQRASLAHELATRPVLIRTSGM
jgi:hypothetical protein